MKADKGIKSGLLVVLIGGVTGGFIAPILNFIAIPFIIVLLIVTIITTIVLEKSDYKKIDKY